MYYSIEVRFIKVRELEEDILQKVVLSRELVHAFQVKYQHDRIQEILANMRGVLIGVLGWVADN